MNKKSILITKTTQKMLASRHMIDEWDIDAVLPIGYYYVVDFGNEGDLPFETVTPEVYAEKFIVGEEIENGFVEVTDV